MTTTETTTFRTNLATELTVLAKGNDLEALLKHSADDLKNNPTLENMLHVQELISIINNK